MLKFKVLQYIFLFLITLAIAPKVYAASFEEIKKIVEERVEKDKNIEHVCLKVNTPHHFKNRDDLELIDIKYLEKANHLQMIVMIDNTEHTIATSYTKAIILPALHKPVRKGEIIEEDMLMESKHPNNKLSHSIILEKKHIIGKSAKKNLPAHQPLHYADISTPVLINKGQKVVLHFRKNNLTIETLGVAMEQGGLGEMIKLKNIDSGKLVIGRVESSESIRVGGG